MQFRVVVLGGGCCWFFGCCDIFDGLVSLVLLVLLDGRVDEG